MKNGNTTYQNLLDTAKAVLKGKLISINVYIKILEKFQINYLIDAPQETRQARTNQIQNEKEISYSRKRERIKTRTELNEMETKNIYIHKESMKQKIGSSKINKVDKPLVRITKNKRENTEIRSKKETLQLMPLKYER